MKQNGFRGIKRQIISALMATLCLQIVFTGSAYSAPARPPQVKDLNLVFLHGAGGDSGDLQLLSDSVMELMPAYISEYERANPDVRISYDTLSRCYPNNVDIEAWASSIADSIEKYFPKKNIILVGHSMGGKTALYATAHNTGGLADRVAAVVTINSPVKALGTYYFPGGADYWQARWIVPSDQGVLGSIAYYDSSKDGAWVGANKHWLALVSGESSPLSAQFDVGGLDPLPRDMDDTIVPVSAQYSEGADTVYYGNSAHDDFSTLPDVSNRLANQILRYVFGKTVEVSVFARGGEFEHEAGWLPIVYDWQDMVGEAPADNGEISHKNTSFSWQEWEDIVGGYFPIIQRSSFDAERAGSIPILTGIVEARWLTPDSPSDFRLYIRTRAAPGTSVKVQWSVKCIVPLSTNVQRERSEIEIATGTPFTGIEAASWLTGEIRDARLVVASHAQGPLRWFKARWRIYTMKPISRTVIEQLPGAPVESQVEDTAQGNQKEKAKENPPAKGNPSR